MFCRFLLSVIWVAAGCAFPCFGASTTQPALATPAPWSTHPRDGKWFIHDAQLIQHITAEGHKLIDAGRTVPMPKLIEQLKPAPCRLALSSPSRTPASPAEIYRDRISGVLIVGSVYKCDKCSNWHCAAAGGFAITETGAFVTNYHVIKKEWGKQQALVIMTADGMVFPVSKVLSASEHEDVAICQADMGDRKLAALALSAAAPVGSSVTVISHPESRWYTLSTGIVTRYYHEVHQNGAAARRLSISADFARGSSGGPLFNEFGDVIGMVASTQSVYYDNENGQQKNLQMVFKQCIPAEAILGMIRR